MRSGERPKRNRAAAGLGVAMYIAGAGVAVLSLYGAATADWKWGLLILPAVGLMKLGSMIYRSRLDVGHIARRQAHEVRRSPVHDYAHNNKAWDNVERWKDKSGLAGGSRTDKAQSKLEEWRLRLKR